MALAYVFVTIFSIVVLIVNTTIHLNFAVVFSVNFIALFCFVCIIGVFSVVILNDGQ